jgi:putative transposase
MLIFNRHQLENVLEEFIVHYNTHPPHRSLNQASPVSIPSTTVGATNPDPRRLRRSDILGGLIHEYRLVV